MVAMPLEEELKMWRCLRSWQHGSYVLFILLILSVLSHFFLLAEPKAKPPPREPGKPQIEIYRYMPKLRIEPSSPTPDPNWTQS